MNDLHEPDTVELELPPAAPMRRPPPFSALVQIDVHGLSHPGKVRTNNEDHFLIARFGRYLETIQTNVTAEGAARRAEEMGLGVVVADGIGGHAAGEVASDLAIRSFLDLVLLTPDWILRLEEEEFIDKVIHRAKERFAQVSAVLADQAARDPALRGLGTTLVAAWSLGADLFVAHVGDSRAYLFHQQQLRQLTRDHTMAQAYVDQGLLSPATAARHRLRHCLTKSLGDAQSGGLPDVHLFELFDGDCLLLCTDGLTEMVPTDKIAATLALNESAERTVQRLVEAALDAGGTDNVTVIVARYRIP